MCMSCGCGAFNERHKPGDITADDLGRAANNANVTIDQAADNIVDSVRKMKSSGQTRATGQGY